MRKMKKYYVQEVIGGWRQNTAYEGTLEGCREFMRERCHGGSWAVVPAEDYAVDYLN